MKRILALLLTAVACFCITSCASDLYRDSENDTSPAPSRSVTTQKKELSESEIKAATADALIELIERRYDTADAGSSRMTVNKIEKDRDDYIVYGTVSLYDKYGKLTTGYSDGSGSYTKSFEIKINGDTGKAYYGGEIS